jgi:hypothetical protein
MRQIDTEFGKEAPVAVHRGKVHNYLGMTINYSLSGKVQISMVDYNDGMLAEIPEDMAGESSTLAPNHLFQVNPSCDKLTEDQAVMFHHNAVKLLFLCKRARPDVQLTTAFLCTVLEYGVIPYVHLCLCLFMDIH